MFPRDCALFVASLFVHHVLLYQPLFLFLFPTHSDTRALSFSSFRAQERKEFAAHGASVGQTKETTLATATIVARSGGPGGGGGDLAAAVALPALAAALTQKQRTVSGRLARHPSAAGPSAALQPGMRRVAGASCAPGGAKKISATTAPASNQRPVWQQLMDNKYGGGDGGEKAIAGGAELSPPGGERGGAGTSSSFERHIGERSARLKAAAAAQQAERQHQRRQVRAPPPSEPPPKARPMPKPPPRSSNCNSKTFRKVSS